MWNAYDGRGRPNPRHSIRSFLSLDLACPSLLVLTGLRRTCVNPPGFTMRRPPSGRWRVPRPLYPVLAFPRPCPLGLSPACRRPWALQAQPDATSTTPSLGARPRVPPGVGRMPTDQPTFNRPVVGAPVRLWAFVDAGPAGGGQPAAPQRRRRQRRERGGQRRTVAANSPALHPAHRCGFVAEQRGLKNFEHRARFASTVEGT